MAKTDQRSTRNARSTGPRAIAVGGGRPALPTRTPPHRAPAPPAAPGRTPAPPVHPSPTPPPRTRPSRSPRPSACSSPSSPPSSRGATRVRTPPSWSTGSLGVSTSVPPGRPWRPSGRPRPTSTARDGARSAAEWLSRKTGESVGSSFGSLRLADQMGDHPGLDAALRTGELSHSRARQVAGVLTLDPEAPTSWSRRPRTATSPTASWPTGACGPRPRPDPRGRPGRLPAHPGFPLPAPLHRRRRGLPPGGALHPRCRGQAARLP